MGMRHLCDCLSQISPKINELSELLAHWSASRVYNGGGRNESPVWQLGDGTEVPQSLREHGCRSFLPVAQLAFVPNHHLGPPGLYLSVLLRFLHYKKQ